MKKFTRLHKVMTVRNKWEDKKMSIVKFQKEWTKRVFFTVENAEWKRMTSTMFARMYDAKNLAYKLI